MRFSMIPPRGTLMRRRLSLSTIVTVVTLGLPMFAFDTPLNNRLKLSFPSLIVSLIIDMVMVFDDSPGAKVSVPANPV